MKLFVHWLITIIALYIATLILPDNLMSVQGVDAWLAFTVMAIVLGLVNIVIRPMLKFLSCGLIILTLGLFTLVINAFLLWFASWICQQMSIGFYVQVPWGAFLGSILVSIVSFVFNLFLRNKK
jgi:putative membrane protein